MMELMKITEVAEVLAVSVSTVRRLIKYHELPHIRVGRALRFNRTDIREWAKRRCEEKHAGK